MKFSLLYDQYGSEIEIEISIEWLEAKSHRFQSCNCIRNWKSL